MEPWYPKVEAGKGNTECPGLNGEIGATWLELAKDVCGGWESFLLSGRGLLEALPLLELTLARAWLELAIWALSSLQLSKSFFPTRSLPLLLSVLESELPVLESTLRGFCMDGDCVWRCTCAWPGACWDGEQVLGDEV